MIFREVEDRDLILRARRGDVDAYNILVSRWEKRVYNYLLRLVKDREDALDLTQETFLKAYRYLARLEDVDRFSPWLYRIAHNESISMFRRNRLPVDDTEAEQPTSVAVSAGGSTVYPVELALSVQRALETLTPEQREVVVLKVYQGFKFHEIAEIVSCPVSTVKSRLYSAFGALKTSLAPMGRTA